MTTILNHEQSEVTLDEIFEDEMVGRKSSPPYYLPRFLIYSRVQREHTLSNQRLMLKRRRLVGRRDPERLQCQRRRTIAEVQADLKLIKDAEFMSMLSDDRADEYDTWLEVGLCPL